MLWGAFSGSGVSELAVLEGKQKAENYIKTLSDYLLPFGMAKYGHRFVFVQDGASIHSAKVTLKWLDEQYYSTDYYSYYSRIAYRIMKRCREQ